MNLGTTIRTLRKSKGLKQKTFAAECGITPSYLSQIENNQKEPNVSILKTISGNLNIPLPILFFLSLDDIDISPEKREAYQLLAPSVKAMMNQFFTSNND